MAGSLALFRGSNDSSATPVPLPESSPVPLLPQTPESSSVRGNDFDTRSIGSGVILGKRKRTNGPYNHSIQVVCSTGETFDIHDGLLKRDCGEYREYSAANGHPAFYELKKYDYDTVELMKEWLYNQRLTSKDIAHDSMAINKDSNAEEKADIPGASPANSLTEENLESQTQRFDKEYVLQSFTGQRDLIHSSKLTDSVGSRSIDELDHPEDQENKKISTLLLTKVYILADELKMPKLLAETATALVTRLGEDMTMPTEALVEAYGHSPEGCMVRQMLIDFTTRFTTSTGTINADEVPHQLLYDLILAIIPFTLRGGDAQAWLEHALHKG